MIRNVSANHEFYQIHGNSSLNEFVIQEIKCYSNPHPDCFFQLIILFKLLVPLNFRKLKLNKKNQIFKKYSLNWTAKEIMD